MHRRTFLITALSISARPAQPAMPPLDYGRSFLQGKWPENRVRFWIESRTRIIDPERPAPLDYLQCASCKSENTFAPKDLFHKENYDFLPIFGPEDGAIFRRKAWLNPDYRQIRKASELWGGQVQRLILPRKVRLLKSNQEIRAATDAAIPLVAQTEISGTRTGLRAILEFPVKTMNIHDGRNLYQVDSGPVAFNAPNSVDFVIEAPTPIPNREPAQVHHYSRLETLPAANRLFACG